MVVGVQLQHMQMAIAALFGLPLLSAVVNALFGHQLGSRAHLSSIAGGIGAWMASIVLLVGAAEGQILIVRGYTWLALGPLSVNLGLLVDPLAALTLAVAATIALAVQVCASGYLRGDAAGTRFCALVDFALAAVVALVLADNFAATFGAWTAMGLCTYLLVGLQRDRARAVRAAGKVAVFEILSATFFALALWLLLVETGGADFAWVGAVAVELNHAAAIGLLLGAAAACRAAQFPFHIWGADATVAPAPVSAWIYGLSAGLAAIYLLARAQPVLAASVLASQVLTIAGAATALLAIALALVASDLHRVLAYMAASQFGFVFATLGMGAYVAGVFHGCVLALALTLLFLASGAVARAVPRVEDVWQMGGLARRMPVVFWTFMSGVLALAGALPVSGFWSRNDILTAALDAGDLAIWMAGCAASLATSLCAFRLVFLVFWGEPRSEAVKNPDKLPTSALGPLVVLALVCAALGGVAYPPGHGLINRFLESVLGPFDQAGRGGLPHAALMAVTTGTAILGAVLAWALYGRSAPDPARDRSGVLLRVLVAEYYVETFYIRVLVRPLEAGARFLWDFVDTVLIDLLAVNGSALLTRGVGWILGRLQSGQVGTYAMVAVAGAVVALSYVW